MDDRSNPALRTVLLVFGLVFTFGLWPLMVFWPSGWHWQPGQAEYEPMIIGVYAVLGIFLVLASRNPGRHRSLILFAAWSSVVHALVMAVQAMRDPAERGHFLGDVPILLVVGVVLLAMAPKEPEPATA